MAISQGTPEWFEQRRGKVTASRIADIMAKTKSGYSTSRQNYLMQLLCERLTGKVEESYKSAAMQRGNDLEPEARNWYQTETGELVDEVSFIAHPTIENAGASPDGLVGNDGLIEIKCPNTATHIETLRTKKPMDKYYKQMQWQMACTGRKWCDFVSFDNRLPDNLAYFCIRIARNDEFIAEIEKEVSNFLMELDATMAELSLIKEQK